ncbi:4-aminobutyrate aminotransferase / (S)-3-amino-2-methylpropionate transaminase [Propionibacterium cyclohexanicum]|uniref:(S)-3-amino-2-methylpropionate transaminase n=1 Tax=Propionibacterium cyclohexanicum TaxID=64702 RepID=A0A1H9QI17_9ACTN|nr:aspartate aminotransferase family protein [Propionibacterium cyclohexanicum]SER60068.1 4-aminobutyrate aminotransferase / (S)-3-amino-2-methylpropionate transaminase [Propionibacterium cyclohexanicum]
MLSTALPAIVTPTLPGPHAAAIIARRADVVPSAVRCGYPVVIERGAGAMVEDVDGNRFLDWVGGVGVLNVGYSHPEVVAAVKQQADRYFHAMSNIITHEGFVDLAEQLARRAPVRGDKRRTFFANSGAEADENAVKMAKAFTGRPNIVVFSGAFHGRTLLTMAMTAKKAYSVGMGPFPDGVCRADFPDLYRAPGALSGQQAIDYYLRRLEEVFEQASPASSVAAVVVEPVQGEGGFIPAPISWVQALRRICDEHQILLVADEVQCGYGRTGRLFATEYWREAGAAPDIVTSAKSIAAGIPLSAVVAREEIMESVPGGVIGGTYNGNPLACAAGLKVLEIMDRDRLPERAVQIGQKVGARYRQMADRFEAIGDIRGLGAMIGLEFVKDRASKEPDAELVSALVRDCAAHGLLVESAGTHGNVLRFLAPLVITDAQLDAGLDILEAALGRCTATSAADGPRGAAA